MAKILIADDDNDMVEFCSRLLPRKGHELVIARNAADAVETATREMPNLILMDMKMPVSENGDVDNRAGLEATRQIKANADTAGIPIVALTGHIMKEFRESIRDAGCADMLEKPIEDFNLLLAAVDRNLGNPAP